MIAFDRSYCTCPNCGGVHETINASIYCTPQSAFRPLDRTLKLRPWSPHFPPEARADALPERRPAAPPPPRPAWPVALRAFG